mgnify:CR=1 FL=1
MHARNSKLCLAQQTLIMEFFLCHYLTLLSLSLKRGTVQQIIFHLQNFQIINSKMFSIEVTAEECYPPLHCAGGKLQQCLIRASQLLKKIFLHFFAFTIHYLSISYPGKRTILHGYLSIYNYIPEAG